MIKAINYIKGGVVGEYIFSTLAWRIYSALKRYNNPNKPVYTYFIDKVILTLKAHPGQLPRLFQSLQELGYKPLRMDKDKHYLQFQLNDKHHLGNIENLQLLTTILGKRIGYDLSKAILSSIEIGIDINTPYEEIKMPRRIPYFHTYFYEGTRYYKATKKRDFKKFAEREIVVYDKGKKEGIKYPITRIEYTLHRPRQIQKHLGLHYLGDLLSGHDKIKRVVGATLISWAI